MQFVIIVMSINKYFVDTCQKTGGKCEVCIIIFLNVIGASAASFFTNNSVQLAVIRHL